MNLLECQITSVHFSFSFHFAVKLNMFGKIGEAYQLLCGIYVIGVQLDERNYNFVMMLRYVQKHVFMWTYFAYDGHHRNKGKKTQFSPWQHIKAYKHQHCEHVGHLC